jgi:hypothetical protein
MHRPVGHPPDGGADDRSEDADIDRRPERPEPSEPGWAQQEGQMSASTRTVQQTLGSGQLGAAFVSLGLATILAAALAFSQLAAPATQTAPAAGAAPVFIDHGSRDEIGTWAPVGAPPVVIDHGSRDEIGTWAPVGAPPVVIDHGSRDEMETAVPAGGWNGPRLRPQ